MVSLIAASSPTHVKMMSDLETRSPIDVDMMVFPDGREALRDEARVVVRCIL